MVRALSAVVVLVLACGCGQQAVQEDRAIDWSRGGDTVAFQHDTEGVYVAGKDGTGLTRIFEPDASVLATSRPLYNPTDGRLIFTTAYGPNGAPRQTNGPFPSPPEGKIVSQRPVRYTCWLRDDVADGNQHEPREIFQASCDHVGYVAAGLAVRWHPDGRRVVFIDAGAASDGRHGVFEFDLQTQKTRAIFPHRADAVIFDFTPGGSRLVCLAGFIGDPRDGSPLREQVAGLWIGEPGDDASWWKAPGSGASDASENLWLIESLRARRPAWTDDDQQFASVATEANSASNQPVTSLLQVTRLATRESQTVRTIQGSFSDLHWSRGGAQLGFVERTTEGDSALRTVDGDGTVSDPINTRPVRKFAGFDATGNKLAYVVADESGLPEPEHVWALVLSPDRLARDSVVVVDSSNLEHGRDVFSGLRVTFPAWSPQEDKLSLWLTFSPRYRSLFSFLLRWGLWPGDPAATLDLTTGDISWMAISPAEELQVGHFYLLNKDYARAWEWYEKANKKLPARQPPRDIQEFVQAIGAPERSQLFEYHCLTQLGRVDDARAKLAEFELAFFPAAAVAGGPASPTLDDVLRLFGPNPELLKHLLHDLYVAEVFMSVDAADAGIAFLRERSARAENDAQRLSGALALAQILLAGGQRDEYLTLCSEQIFPLGCEAWNTETASPAGAVPNASPAANPILSIIGSQSLLPLADPEFLAGISDPVLRQALDTWTSKRPQYANDLQLLAIDLFLRAAHLTLGDLEEAGACEARISANPLAKATLGEKPIADAVRDLTTSARRLGFTQ
ncbi:MAG: hypothetical protein HY290_02530 [Planctomycetia bacterium]|nr:hypothetical protein [Planctomycetia bacterium]